MVEWDPWGRFELVKVELLKVGRVGTLRGAVHTMFPGAFLSPTGLGLYFPVHLMFPSAHHMVVQKFL